MNRKMLFGIIIVLAIAAPMAVIAQEELPDLGGRTITVAVENAYPPFNYYDEQGNTVGWDYDVINEICARLNCVPEFVETSWDGMILAVSNDEFDMAADGITITEDRAQIVDFSDGYMALEQVLLVRIDEDRFATVEEFVAGDYTLGVQLGTTNFIAAENLLGAGSERITAFDTFPIAVQAVIAGDIDAAIMDDVAGIGYVGANAEDVRLLDDTIVTGEELGFIFPPGSELTPAINLALQSMRADGTLTEINVRWDIPEAAE